MIRNLTILILGGVLLVTASCSSGSTTDQNGGPANPTATHVLIQNVVRLGTLPVFRFNAFDTANPPAPTIVLATPLTATAIASASRITISFVTRELKSSGTSPQATPLQDQVDLRSADPNQPKPAPQCT